jgi:predicted Zn-dependent protease
MAEVLEKQYTARKVAQRQDELMELARAALKASPADQTQVRINAMDSALTRFANSVIHQNTFERDAIATLTARVGQCEGTVTTNVLTADGVRDAVERATAAARVSAANPELAGFPEGPRDYPIQVDYFEATAACTPEDRAKKVVAGFEVCDDTAFTAAGTLSTTQYNFAVANSRGVEAAYNTTAAKYTVLYTGPDSSGYAERSTRNIGEIDTSQLALKALDTAKRSANPRRDLPAGEYQVVLGPECVTTLLGFLVWLGFSGKDYNDGASFMYGKLGEPVTGGEITIIDDPLDPRTLGLPCDAAGVPKQRLALIEAGVAKAVAHDANSAMKAGTATTGHDTGFNYPAPGNLVLFPGNSSPEELIAGVERGVYVSRFHYTNVVDPLNTVITGMTRDGTFLIENGALSAGLTNFRFTQNVLQALAGVSGMSAEQVYHGAFWGSGGLVPSAMRVDRFNFSGKTEF